MPVKTRKVFAQEHYRTRQHFSLTICIWVWQIVLDCKVQIFIQTLMRGASLILLNTITCNLSNFVEGVSIFDWSQRLWTKTDWVQKEEIKTQNREELERHELSAYLILQAIASKHFNADGSPKCNQIKVLRVNWLRITKGRRGWPGTESKSLIKAKS